MVREEVEFLMDILQDTRADSRIIDRYYTLIEFIFKNVSLDWRGECLSIKSDEKVMNLLKALEPERYKVILEQLQHEKKLEDNK